MVWFCQISYINRFVHSLVSLDGATPLTERHRIFDVHGYQNPLLGSSRATMEVGKSVRDLFHECVTQ